MRWHRTADLLRCFCLHAKHVFVVSIKIATQHCSSKVGHLARGSVSSKNRHRWRYWNKVSHKLTTESILQRRSDQFWPLAEHSGRKAAWSNWVQKQVEAVVITSLIAPLKSVCSCGRRYSSKCGWRGHRSTGQTRKGRCLTVDLIPLHKQRQLHDRCAAWQPDYKDQQ